MTVDFNEETRKPGTSLGGLRRWQRRPRAASATGAAAMRWLTAGAAIAVERAAEKPAGCDEAQCRRQECETGQIPFARLERLGQQAGRHVHDDHDRHDEGEYETQRRSNRPIV